MGISKSAEGKKALQRASQTQTISDDERRGLIAEAAYFRSERRGFVAGDAVADWLAAEAEINERLAKKD